MKARKPRTSRALLDVILSVMALILLMVAPPTEGDTIPKVDYVLEVSWEEGLDTDIDTWLMLPDGVKMSYGNKDVGYASIDRDDLGRVNDPAPPNIEVTKLRALKDGIYYVSIYNYRGVAKGEVWIVFRQVNTKRIIWSSKVVMPEKKIEVPIFVFLIVDGKIENVRASERRIVGP